MKRPLSYLLSFAILVGCADDQTTLTDPQPADIAVETGRLVFKDTETFYATIDKLGRMNESELQQWERTYPISSLKKSLQYKSEQMTELTADEETFSLFPLGYRAVLNTKGEVKVGAQILWYHKGVKHFIEGEQELETVQANPEKSSRKGPYFIEKIDSKGLKINTNERTQVNVGATDARYQKEFLFYGSKRKYVNELHAFYEITSSGLPAYYNYRTTLFLKIKLEYKGSNGWKLAGEYRFIQYGITGDVSFNSYTGSTGPHAVTHVAWYPIETRSAHEIPLLTANSTYFSSVPLYREFDVEIKGGIYQAISSTLPTAPGGSHMEPWTIGSTDTNPILW